MKAYIFLINLLCVSTLQVIAQRVPLEVFAGNKTISFDLMAMKHVPVNKDTTAELLFFSRSRVINNYQDEKDDNLPQFGITHALSLPIQKLNGLGPILVVQVFNRGTYLKPGLHYLKLKKSFLLFAWLAIELEKNPYADFYILSRFTPSLNKHLQAYFQIELINNLPTQEIDSPILTQRARLGLKINTFQFGFAIDLSENLNLENTIQSNVGMFIRHEF